MNKYLCYWDRKKVQIEAETTYEAQQKALLELQKETRKKVRSYQITVMLVEKDGQLVFHSTTEF